MINERCSAAKFLIVVFAGLHISVVLSSHYIDKNSVTQIEALSKNGHLSSGEKSDSSSPEFGPNEDCAVDDFAIIQKQAGYNSSNGEKSGWAKIEVSPKAFISTGYYGTFRISIFRKENELNGSMFQQYYYSPALILDPSSAVVKYSIFNERWEMSFSVLMWDGDFEDFVIQAIKNKTKENIPKSSVRILPIEEIRIALSTKNPEYEIFDKWVSYASQPAVFKFRFFCISQVACKALQESMKTNPEDFINNLVVYYSLETQKSAKRSLEIRAEHIKGGKLATALQQKVQGGGVAYMTSEDAKEMTMEMATNIMALEVQDEEFVSTDQALQISTLIESILQIIPQSTESFDAQMWNSVFWKDDNARPDKICSEMSHVYESLSTELQSQVKKMTETDTSFKSKVEIDAWIVSVKAEYEQKNKHMTKDEQEKLEKFASVSDKTQSFTGEKFVPKPMKLSRVNTASFHSTTAISAVQVKVGKTTSELSSRLNLLTKEPISFKLRARLSNQVAASEASERARICASCTCPKPSA